MPKKSARSFKKSWKNDKKAIILRRKVLRTISISLLVLISFTFLLGYFSYKSLTVSFVSAAGSDSFDLVNHDIFTVSLISINNLDSNPIVTRKTSVFIYDTDTKKVLRYDIPLNHMLDVPGKFGEESVSKVFALGYTQNQDIMSGVDLVNSSIKKLIGINVDRYVLTYGDFDREVYEILSGKNPLEYISFDTIRNLGLKFKTNLSLSELSHISSFASSLSKDDFISGFEAYDENIRELTFDSEIAIEKKNIAILNGSEISGVAWYGKRIAENMGIRVIASGNASGKYDESVIVTDSLASETLGYLKRFFEINKVILKENSEIEELLRNNEGVVNRADITIIIGLDKAKNL